MRVGGVVWAVRAGIHLKMYQMTCQLSESATAWPQTKIKVWVSGIAGAAVAPSSLLCYNLTAAGDNLLALSASSHF